MPLSPDERAAIANSKAAAIRGEFATDAQVRAVWAKQGRKTHVKAHAKDGFFWAIFPI
jgi:hypothetical protein